MQPVLALMVNEREEFAWQFSPTGVKPFTLAAAAFQLMGMVIANVQPGSGMGNPGWVEEFRGGQLDQVNQIAGQQTKARRHDD